MVMTGYTQLTETRPGPQGCPTRQAVGYCHQSGSCDRAFTEPGDHAQRLSITPGHTRTKIDRYHALM